MTDEQIIEALAVRVMCWHRSEDIGVEHWHDEAYNCVAEIPRWDPLNDPAASKQVREKLASTCCSVVIEWNNSTGVWYCQIWPSDQSAQNFYAEAKDAERAVALAALKSAGVEVAE